MHEPIRPSRSTSDDSRAQTGAARRPDPVHLRITAWLFAGTLDRMLAVGTPATAGGVVSVHARRLTSVREREAVARSFRRCVVAAHDDTPRFPRRFASRIPVDRGRIVAAEDIIDAVTLWMHSPRPVGVRGMARLRRLLADGAGPLYLHGRGDLEARLRAALAAL